jgi:hypothetical protein
LGYGKTILTLNEKVNIISNYQNAPARLPGLLYSSYY